MARVGDWTSAVHKALERKFSRPVWFCGPFPSPYNSADMYDNQIFIVCGVGITPALSALHSRRNSGRVNIIWMLRDNHMLNFFLKYVLPNDDGWFLIYYTGKEPIDSRFEKINTNIRIIKKRPNLELVITNMIYGIQSKSGLPERVVKSSESKMIESLKGKFRQLDETGISTTKKVVELMKYAELYGYKLEPLIGEVDGTSDMKVPENIADNGPIFDNAGDRSEHDNVVSTPEVSQSLSIHDVATNDEDFAEEKKINNENDDVDNSMPQDPRRGSYDVYNHVHQQPGKKLQETPRFVPKRSSDLLVQKSRSRRRSIYNILMEETNGDEENRYSSNSDRKSITLFLVDESVDKDNMKAINETKDPMIKRVSEELGNNSSQMIDVINQDTIHAYEHGSLDETVASISSNEENSMLASGHASNDEENLEGESNCNSKDRENSQPRSNERPSSLNTLKSSARLNRNASYTLFRDASTTTFDPCCDNRNVAKNYLMELQETKQGKDILASWDLLYCGGNKHIKKKLKKISREYLLDLNTECFKW